jgi:hypothetical protein
MIRVFDQLLQGLGWLVGLLGKTGFSAANHRKLASRNDGDCARRSGVAERFLHDIGAGRIQREVE